jgi:hypothetical protein
MAGYSFFILPDGQITSDLRKSCQAKNPGRTKNISLFPKGKSGAHLSPSRPDKRGVGHRHERGTGMRWTPKLRLTSVAEAYGEDVWS